MYDVRLPTYVNVSKKTQKACNLNIYRNLHHHHLNNQKKNFDDEVKPLLKAIPHLDKIVIHYTIYAPRNGRLDTMNVGSIVDKYFSDTLVHAKRIMDDHYGHIVHVSFSFGGVVKLDGHAIATIYELLEDTEKQEEEVPMRILLDEQDIQTALETYVEGMGIAGATGVTLTGENIEAEVQIGEPTTDKPKSRGGRPKGSRNKAKAPVEEATDVEESTNDSSDGATTGGSDAPQTSVKETAATESETPANPSKTEEGKNSSSIFGEDEESPQETKSKPVKKGSSIFDE